MHYATINMSSSTMLHYGHMTSLWLYADLLWDVY